MTSTDLEKLDARGQIFQDDLHNARTVLPRTTKFNTCEGACFYGISYTPTAKGGRPRASHFLEFPSIYAYAL